MKKYFTEHPHSLGETYSQHFIQAWRFGSAMLVGSLACLIHAVFPFLFKKTASQVLFKLMNHFIERAPGVEDNMIDLGQRIEAKKLQ